MESNERLILEIEAEKGETHQRAWENTMKPIFDAKMSELYEAFTEHPTTDLEGLRIIKLQHNVLKMLNDQFQSIITTGKMARIKLNEEIDNGK